MPKIAQPPHHARHLPRYIAFLAGKRIAEGSETEITAQLAALSVSPFAYPSAATEPAQALVFDLTSGEQIELPAAPTPTSAEPAAPVRPGRPRLGVVAREITLLPHDWEWLSQQPGGASVTLRKLVLAARRLREGDDRVRQAKVACYRFITAIAGNEPGFEEATRALFAEKPESFMQQTKAWPEDVRAHARNLADAAFSIAPTQPKITA